MVHGRVDDLGQSEEVMFTYVLGDSAWLDV
jgi:hypothetical protein